LLDSLKSGGGCKKEDDIGQYLLDREEESTKKGLSQNTMESEKVDELQRIVDEVENVTLPKQWSL
jgi:hypothetical protein